MARNNMEAWNKLMAQIEKMIDEIFLMVGYPTEKTNRLGGEYNK